MAKAYKCDGCGKLISTPAKIISSCYIKQNGKSYSHFAKLFFFDNDYNDEPEDTVDKDYCLECAQILVKNISITGGE